MSTILSKLMSGLALACAASFIALPAWAEAPSSTVAAQPAQLKQDKTLGGVTEYRLENGLRVLLAPDDSKPTTTVNMTYLVGSRQENYGQTGMAHLLEHMLFRGTPTMHNALAEFSRRGLQANGTTSSDRTNYYASFAADPETLDWYLRWQADAMVNALIAKSDLDSEMTVVRNELERGENNPFQVLHQKMLAAAYQWHNYGHSTIGARSDVENVDIGQLRAFYKEYYQPDNAILIVSGKFDVDQVLGTIAAAFGDIPRPERALPPEYTVEPVQDGEREVTLRRHGGSPLIAALYHAPAMASPDFTALDLGVAILSDTPSGRLYKALVEQKLATDVFGFTAGMRDPGYAMFGAQLEEGMDQALALETMDRTLETTSQEPFTQTELERVRNRWLTGWMRTYSDPAALAAALSDAAADGDWRLFFLERDRVGQASLEDVQKATEAYLVASNRTNGRYIPTEKPERAPALTRPDVESLLRGYKSTLDTAVVNAFDPSPENIDASTQREPLVLPNGTIKLALLPKPTRGDRVHARLLLQFGDEETLKGYRTISSATADLLDRGTSVLSRQEIEDKINALKASVSIDGGGTNLAVSMSTTSENLPDLIGLVMHILREADFPEDEIARYQRQATASIRNLMSEPSALAARKLMRHADVWPEDDIRYTPTFEQALEDTQQLDRDKLAAFHERFYGMGTLSFSAVGAFEPEEVRKALAMGVSGWKAGEPYTRVPDPYHQVKPEHFEIDTPDKANAFYMAMMPLRLQDTDPRYPALYLANYLLGGGETSRLWTRIRVQDGLSYDVRSRLSVSSYEPSSSWVIYAIHAPENSAHLERDVEEELARVLDQGFTEDEVREGIRALLNYRKLARAQDGVLAGAWIDYLQLDRSFAWSGKIDRELAALTAADLNDAVRATLKPADFSSALAADESRQEAPEKPVN